MRINEHCSVGSKVASGVGCGVQLFYDHEFIHSDVPETIALLVPPSVIGKITCWIPAVMSSVFSFYRSSLTARIGFLEPPQTSTIGIFIRETVVIKSARLHSELNKDMDSGILTLLE